MLTRHAPVVSLSLTIAVTWYTTSLSFPVNPVSVLLVVPSGIDPIVVVNYRTSSTGLQPQDLVGPDAVSFSEAQAMAAQLLRGRIVVGHSLWLDLQVSSWHVSL